LYLAQLVSILLIIFLSYFNTRGIQGGKTVQTTFTVAKLLSLFGLIVFGFLLGAKSEVWNQNWSGIWEMKSLTASAGEILSGPVAGTAIIGAIAASMVGSIFSSDSWNNVTFIAGEIKNPKRNIGLSLFLGTLIVTIIYVTANVMYSSVLPLNEIAFAPQDRVATAASKIIFGDAGTSIIAGLIMVSTFGCNNGLILAGARVYYTMAQDGLFFKKTGTLNKFSVPAYAIWIQCILASIWCISGRYNDLLDMIAIVVVIFYALTILGIFILRKKRPDMERPYKAFGYPVLPVIYILLAIVFCIFLIKMKPLYSGIGLGIVLLGIPLYFIAVSGKKK
jgi:APA family basic amino acid/polyamine antiporter